MGLKIVIATDLDHVMLMVMLIYQLILYHAMETYIYLVQIHQLILTANIITFDNSNNYTYFNQNIGTYGNFKLNTGSLILNNLILSNANLQRIQYLNNISYDVSQGH
jgi:hypothetical protein